MLFKVFTGNNVEKNILKAGFQINAYEKHSVYNGESLEYSGHSPKNYIKNGEVWEIKSAYDFYEPLSKCILVKTPFLPFDELWDLALHAKKEDDRIGALVLMYTDHFQELFQKRRKVMAQESISKEEIRVLKILSPVM